MHTINVHKISIKRSQRNKGIMRFLVQFNT